MKCPRCGADLTEGATVCSFCRNALSNNITTEVDEVKVEMPQQEIVEEPVQNQSQPQKQSEQPKKKFRWYIPLLLLLGPAILQSIISRIGHFAFGYSWEAIQNMLIYKTLDIIKVFSWLAFWPSIIIEIIRYTKKR